jgi:hypothetical protein
LFLFSLLLMCVFSFLQRATCSCVWLVESWAKTRGYIRAKWANEETKKNQKQSILRGCIHKSQLLVLSGIQSVRRELFQSSQIASTRILVQLNQLFQNKYLVLLLIKFGEKKKKLTDFGTILEQEESGVSANFILAAHGTVNGTINLGKQKK